MRKLQKRRADYVSSIRHTTLRQYSNFLVVEEEIGERVSQDLPNERSWKRRRRKYIVKLSLTYMYSSLL